MARLRDQLPQRLSDPLFNIKHHVARRTGMVDPVREKRKRREQERQPRVEPGLPREVVDLVGHDHAGVYSPVAHSHTPGVTHVASAPTAVANGTAGTVSAVCPGGTNVTGGGGSHNGTPTLVYLTHSFPANITTWSVTVNNQSGVSINVTAFAVCVENPIA